MAIKFRILGFPITMSWVFPAFLLFLGYISDLSGTELAVWVVFGTFAILVHELGHAVAFRHYGLESSIAFWGLGGVTIPNDQVAAVGMDDMDMLVVSLAGPAVGLVLGVIGLALQGPLASQGPDVRSAVGTWTFVNLGWGIFNLMPIGILDGGQALAHLLRLGFGRRGQLFAIAFNIAFSAIVAAVAIANRYMFVALMAVLFGLANPYQYRALFEGVFPKWAERRRRHEAELRRLQSFDRVDEVPASSLLDGDWRRPQP